MKFLDSGPIVVRRRRRCWIAILWSRYLRGFCCRSILIYSQAIQAIEEGMVTIEGRRVLIRDEG